MAKRTNKNTSGSKTSAQVVAAKPKRQSTPKPNATSKRSASSMSALDAAAKVLQESTDRKPMNCKQLIEAMFAKKYWTTNGKTPASTLYSAIVREITVKGKESRFKKSDRGTFALV